MIKLAYVSIISIHPKKPNTMWLMIFCATLISLVLIILGLFQVLEIRQRFNFNRTTNQLEQANKTPLVTTSTPANNQSAQSIPSPSANQGSLKNPSKPIEDPLLTAATNATDNSDSAKQHQAPVSDKQPDYSDNSKPSEPFHLTPPKLRQKKASAKRQKTQTKLHSSQSFLADQQPHQVILYLVVKSSQRILGPQLISLLHQQGLEYFKGIYVKPVNNQHWFYVLNGEKSNQPNKTELPLEPLKVSRFSTNSLMIFLPLPVQNEDSIKVFESMVNFAETMAKKLHLHIRIDEDQKPFYNHQRTTLRNKIHYFYGAKS